MLPAHLVSWPLQCGFCPAGFGRLGTFLEQVRGHALTVQFVQFARNTR